MSPETALAVMLALLAGPTAIWLAYLVIRGNQGRYGGSFLAGSESSGRAQSTTNQTEELIAEGFWVCRNCRSMNRREVKLCYACRKAQDRPPARAVPVMAEGIARPPDKVPVAAVAHPRRRTTDAAVARTMQDRPPTRGVPVMAEGIARPPDKVPVAAVARPRQSRTDTTDTAVAGLAAVAAAAAGVESPVREPGHAPPAAPSKASASAFVSATFCPFLRLAHDRATLYGFPDPRNVCYASPARSGASKWSARRIIMERSATARPQPIGAGHQGSTCLTAAHEQCAWYLAGDAASAIR